MPVLVASRQRVCFRDFELDLTSGELHKDGQKVSLPPKAFGVLRSLVERPGEVVTREDLRARLWVADTPEEHEPLLGILSKTLIGIGRQPLARGQKLDCHPDHKKQYSDTRPRQCPGCSHQKQHLCLPENPGSSRN